MIYEYVVRLFSKSIIKILYFLPILLHYEETDFTVALNLNNPLTQETKKLLKAGFTLNIECYVSLIVNDKKLYKKKYIRSIQYQNEWKVDSISISETELQKKSGFFSLSFNQLHLQEGDTIALFGKCEIIEDYDFNTSTGFKTAVLWDYYIPQIRQSYYYHHGEFEEIED